MEFSLPLVKEFLPKSSFGTCFFPYNVDMEEHQTTPHQANQINKAWQVFKLQRDNPKMSQTKACKQVGIDPKTYHKWMATQDEPLKELENIRNEIERIEYAEMLTKKSAVTDYFLREAMKPGISLTERIKASKYIDKRFDELGSRYHPVDIQAEQDFLSGPTQIPGTSRLANRVADEEEGNETAIRNKDNPEIADNQGDQTDKSEKS